MTVSKAHTVEPAETVVEEQHIVDDCMTVDAAQPLDEEEALLLLVSSELLSSDGQLPILMPKMRLMHGNFGSCSSNGSGKVGKLKRSTGGPPPKGMITKPVCSLEEPETDVLTHWSLVTDEGNVIIDTPCGSVVKVVDTVMGSTAKGIMPPIKLVDCVVEGMGIVPRVEDDATDGAAVGCAVESAGAVLVEDVADDSAADC